MEQAGNSLFALFAARMEVATLALWGALLVGYVIGQFLPMFLLVEQAGKLADRVSINIELPTKLGLTRLAPDKSVPQIESAMAHMGHAIESATDARRRYRSAPRFAPAGQSTQMIVGADQANDLDIIERATGLYDRFRMRRVYYSAFSPIPDASAVLPPRRPPLAREHRLYQSDWLFRFYGYSVSDLRGAAADDGMLPLDIDPKLAWALRFRDAFPVDVNRASREQLLRIPGLGVRAVNAVIAARRHRRLCLDDLARLTVSIRKIRPFVVTSDWRPTLLTDRIDLKAQFAPQEGRQLELFA